MKMHVASGLAAVAMISLSVSACGAGEIDSKGGIDVGLRLTDEASAADVGLPKYPGAKPHKDPGESSSGGKFGLSAGSVGLKVVALEMESSDRPQEVAAFYRKALSKYGQVLECTEGKRSPKPEASDALVCDPDDPGSHSIVYKVGTNENQRIVAIKPLGKGTQFSLVHLDIRGDSKR